MHRISAWGIVFVSFGLSSCVGASADVPGAPGVAGAPPVLPARPRAHSQTRRPGESGSAARLRYMRERGLPRARDLPSDTPTAQAAPWAQLKLYNLPDWSGVADLAAAFRSVRDKRFLDDADHPGTSRRSTWLYPDDGCYARSALAERNLEAWGYPAAAKLFVFGDLSVKTSNAPGGSVDWWYHVVPAVRLGGDAFVIDPAVDPSAPLPLASWISRIAPGGTDKVTAVICAAHSYVPETACFGATVDGDADSRNDQLAFLPDEWNRIVALQRDPTRELGDAPPWAAPVPVPVPPSEGAVLPGEGAVPPGEGIAPGPTPTTVVATERVSASAFASASSHASASAASVPAR